MLTLSKSSIRSLTGLFCVAPVVYACSSGSPSGKTSDGPAVELPATGGSGASKPGTKPSSGGSDPTGGTSSGSGGSSSAGTSFGGANGGMGGVASCGALAECGALCVDLASDTNHCGECGVSCAAGDHASAACKAGSCGLLCESGYGDCNADGTDGCETLMIEDVDNCGGCGVTCTPGAFASAKCSDSSCVSICEEGHGDCDGEFSNGCEAAFIDDKYNCGGCGVECAALCKKGTCLSAKRVFVTSVLYTGDLGGLDGADAKCSELGKIAGIGGNYRAWLSDSTGSPLTRFDKSADPYVLVDGTVIAANWTDLVDGTLNHAIDKDEFGGVAPIGNTSCGGGGFRTAFSNTTLSGELIESGYSCQDWSSTKATGAHWGKVEGSVEAPNVDYWTNWCVSKGNVCALTSALYCFEQ